MKQWKQQALSAGLALSMALTFLPGGALAAEKPLAQDGGSAVLEAPELLGLQKPGPGIRYVRNGLDNQYLFHLYPAGLSAIPTDGGELWGSRGGQTRLLAPVGANQFDEPPDGKVRIADVNLGTPDLTPGLYTLELHSGGKVYPIDAQMQVLSAEPAIRMGMCQLTERGRMEIEVPLTLTGSWPEELLETITVTVRKDGVKVGGRTGGFSGMEHYYRGELTGKIRVPLTEALTRPGSYTLELSCGGTEPVLDLTEDGSRQFDVSEPSLRVGGVELLSPTELQVKLTGMQTGSEYKLCLKEEYGTDPAYAEQTFTAGAAVETHTLKYTQGLGRLPEELSIEVEGTTDGGQDAQPFRNPYGVKEDNDFRFEPQWFSTAKKEFPFEITMGLGYRNWKNSGNVLIARDFDGKEVGRSTNMQVVPGNDSDSLHIVGTLRLQDNLGDYPYGNLILNGEELMAYGENMQIHGTARLRAADHNYPVGGWSQDTHWIGCQFGMLPITADLINVSGKAAVEVRQPVTSGNELPALVCESQLQAGAAIPNRDGLRYRWLLTAAELSGMTDGAAYSIWIRDESGSRLQLDNKIVWKNQPMGDPKDNLHFPEAKAGESAVTGVYYNYEFFNHSEDELAVLDQLRLTHTESQTVYSVTGHTLHTGWIRNRGGEQDYQAQVRLTLDGPLQAGDYTVSCDGQELPTYFYVNSADGHSFLSFRGVSTKGVVKTNDLPHGSYTARVFQNGKALSTAPIVLEYPQTEPGKGAYALSFDPGCLTGLPKGFYVFRIYRDGSAIAELPLNILEDSRRIPTVSLVSGDNWDVSVVTQPQFSVDIANYTDYPYVRFADSESELETLPFEPCRDWYDYTWPGTGDGMGRIYLDFSTAASGGETCRVVKEFYCCPSGNYGLQVPESFRGKQEKLNEREYGFTVTTLVPFCQVYALFRTADGLAACREMERMPRDADGRGVFSLQFPEGELLLYQGSTGYGEFNSSEAVSVELLVTAQDQQGHEELDGDCRFYVDGTIVQREKREVTFPEKLLASHISTYRCENGEAVGQPISDDSSFEPAPISLVIPKKAPITYSFIGVAETEMNKPVPDIPVTWFIDGSGTTGETEKNTYQDRYVQPAGTNILNITVNPGDSPRNAVKVWAEGRYEDWGDKPYTIRPLDSAFGSCIVLNYEDDDNAPAVTGYRVSLTDRGTVITWSCADEDARLCTVRWSGGEKTAAPEEGVMVLPDVTAGDCFTLVMEDLAQNETTLVMDTRLQLVDKVSGQPLQTPDVLPRPQEGSQSYDLVMPGDDGNPVQGVVWTAVGTLPDGVTLDAGCLTVSASSAAGTLTLQGKVGERTVERTITLKPVDFTNEFKVESTSKPAVPDAGSGAPEMVEVSLTVTPPEDNTIPVNIMLVGYDENGKMFTLDATGVLRSGMEAVTLTATGLDSNMKAFMLDAETGAPICVPWQLGK